MTVVNLMPAHRQAPVALWLLARDFDACVSKIAESGAEAVLVPAGHELAARLADALGDSVRVVECNPELGFVYANPSAAAKVLSGEKPIPSCANGEGTDSVIEGSALLADEGSRWVWLEGASEPVCLGATATVAELVAAAGAEEPKAVYVGYPAGTLTSAANAETTVELASDYVRVYTAKNCMANALNEICQLYRHETCGRCVFGHEGSHQIATIVADVCRKKGKPSDLALLRDLCPVMQSQCLCEQGRVMARTVMAFLDLFEAEISAHIGKKTCPAGECKAFLTYHILASKCQACNACVDSCEYGAIVTAGAVKPKCPPKPIPFRKR